MVLRRLRALSLQPCSRGFPASTRAGQKSESHPRAQDCPAAGSGSRAGRQAPPAKQAKQPKLALEQGGRKWVVEGHQGRQDLVLQDVDPKQAVYIFGCTNCTVQVRGRQRLQSWQLTSLAALNCTVQVRGRKRLQSW